MMSEIKVNQDHKIPKLEKLDSAVKDMSERPTEDPKIPDSATITDEEISKSVHNDETSYTIHSEETNNSIEEYLPHRDYKPFDNIQTVPNSSMVNEEPIYYIDQQSDTDCPEPSSTKQSQIKHESDTNGFYSAENHSSNSSPSVKCEINSSQVQSQSDKTPESNGLLHVELMKEQSELETLKSYVTSLKQEKEQATQQVQDLQIQVLKDFD